MNGTKKKIILAAVDLFNDLGLSNVRNQDIAKKAGISLSNFNYHFATKQDIVMAVCAYMTTRLKEDVYGEDLLTKEGQGLIIMKKYFDFEYRFKFFYLDTYNVLQNYPTLKKEFDKQIEEAIQIIKNLNYMSIGRGYMIPEPIDRPGLYEDLARQIWVNNHFWYTVNYIKGIEGSNVKKGFETCFSISYPYLTESGKHAYQEFINTL